MIRIFHKGVAMKISKMFLVLFSFCLATTAGFAEDRPWLGPKADLNKDGVVGVEEAQKAEETWKQIHREDRQEKREEIKEKREEIREERKEYRQEKREEFKEKREELKEKREDWKEKKQEIKEDHPRMDHDNNPPGMAGGPGSNWENKPGPQGGPGASPNRGPQSGGGQSGPGKKK